MNVDRDTAMKLLTFLVLPAHFVVITPYPSAPVAVHFCTGN